jgi:hypothetical protein
VSPLASKRPRRGPAGRNVIVEGDTGIFGGPQGGAHPGASESGDLEAREFGVPQADVPGGVKHLVNPEAKPAATARKPERPADYHKYHGVPSDDGQYHDPPGVEHDKPERPAPEPKFVDAVPVYLTAGPGDRPRIRTLYTSGPMLISPGNDPVRLADRDPHRVNFWIQVESTASVATKGVRIGKYEDVSEGRGMYLGGGGASYPQNFGSQDDVWVVSSSYPGSAAAAVNISWGYETEVPAAGLDPE